MHSGKIDKTHRYAEELDRFQFKDRNVTIHGNNDDHAVAFHEGECRCECDFFVRESTCAHAMALEMALDGMVPVADPVC
jgi:hypothetical protein